MASVTQIPATQSAVQIVGPGQLKLNPAKPVPTPGPHQILLRVEACGLCFSDLKVMSQFHQHARKSEAIGGIQAEILQTIAGYVPGDKPTVPGHEVVARVVSVGPGVTDYKPGERYLLQPDLRFITTAGSNSALGYNFEGALQEYILLDERVMTEPTGERYLLPAKEELGASQIALVEPWACVEDSYVTPERPYIRPGGSLLVVVDAGRRIEGLRESLLDGQLPATITLFSEDPAAVTALEQLGAPVIIADDLAGLPNEGFDDIIYFGSSKERIDVLCAKIGLRGIINVVTGGRRIGAPVSLGIGRVHYGYTRWVGSTGTSAADGYRMIPANGEIRDGDTILVIGAGGPMGQMHSIRSVSIPGRKLSVIAADVDDARLAALARKAEPIARENEVPFRTVNTKHNPLTGEFGYIAIMAPVPAIVVDAIALAKPGGVINLFAGIPSPVRHDMDLDAIIEKRIFLFGTSGSTIQDMKIVLGKVTDGSLNTNASVDAISGIAGAIDGIKAVENRTMAGKIIVYPMLRDVGLIPLEQLPQRFPTVAAKLKDGQWCREAEDELLKVAATTEA